MDATQYKPLEAAPACLYRDGHQFESPQLYQPLNMFVISGRASWKPRPINGLQGQRGILRRLSRTRLFHWTNSAALSPARENRFVRDAAIESPRPVRMSSEQGSSLGRFVRRPSRGAPRESRTSNDGEDLGKGGRRTRRRSHDSDNIARRIVEGGVRANLRVVPDV